MEYKKIKYMYHLATKYPISCLYLAFIWILCFADMPETPLDDVTLMDKWAHTLMYAGTCSTIWYEYLRQHEKVDKARVALLAWLAPILMSGLIEILQATCTGGRRSGDWLDFWANAIGVTVGAAIGILLARCHAMKKKGC